MDVSTQTHLTLLRDLLSYRLKVLRGEVDAAERAARGLAPIATHEVVDREDEAAQSQLSDVDQAQERRDLDEMVQIEAALYRLDAGTYGDCVECGEAIGLQRLMAQPAALRCAACQVVTERARVH
jgi:RNA polymerase-binding transcription factor DksA